MSYSEMKRQQMREEMELEERFHPLNKRLTWWGRNSEFVGAVLWCFAIAVIGTGLVWVYGILPR